MLSAIVSEYKPSFHYDFVDLWLKWMKIIEMKTKSIDLKNFVNALALH